MKKLLISISLLFVAIFAVSCGGKTKLENFLVETEGGFVFYDKAGEDVYLAAYEGEGFDITLPEYYNGKRYYIGGGCFKNDYRITSVVIPDTILYIEEQAFAGCSGLTSAVIGDGVTKILPGCFSECVSLKSIVIGASVELIYERFVIVCTSLEEITFKRTTGNWCRFSESGTSLEEEHVDLTDPVKNASNFKSTYKKQSLKWFEE